MYLEQKNNAKITISGTRIFIWLYNRTKCAKCGFYAKFHRHTSIASGFYIQYSVMGLVDTAVNYGIKGGVKVGYRF